MSSRDEDTAVSDVAHPMPVARASNDCLVVVYQRDGGAGRCIKLDRLPLRLGRDPDNELVLADDGVSRRHARIEKRADRMVLMDVGSTNGTLLNDAELSGIADAAHWRSHSSRLDHLQVPERLGPGSRPARTNFLERHH